MESLPAPGAKDGQAGEVTAVYLVPFYRAEVSLTAGRRGRRLRP